MFCHSKPLKESNVLILLVLTRLLFEAICLRQFLRSVCNIVHSVADEMFPEKDIMLRSVLKVFEGMYRAHFVVFQLYFTGF